MSDARPEPYRLLHTIHDAEHILSLSRPTIYRLLRDGKLTAVKCGSRTLIPAASIAAFVASLPSVADAA